MVVADSIGRDLRLSYYAEVETYSVLTRLPPPQRLTPAAALLLIRTNFPHARRLPVSGSVNLLEELVNQSIAGGATYDALVALTARHHGLTMVSTDARAATTYSRMGVDHVLV